jgi:hypothetical protein
MWAFAALLVSGWAGGCSSGGGGGQDTLSPDVAEVAPESEEAALEVTPEAEVAPEAEGLAYPDPAFVHKLDSPQQIKASDPYSIDEPEHFRTTDLIADLHVTALAAFGDLLLAGTPSGVFTWDAVHQEFDALATQQAAGAVKDFSHERLGDGRVALLGDSKVLVINPQDGQGAGVDVIGKGFTAVGLAPDALWLGGPEGLSLSASGSAPVPIAQAQGFAVRDLAVDGTGKVWLATPGGLRIWDGNALATWSSQAGWLPDDDVRVLVLEASGVVWAGCATGFSRIDPASGNARMLKAGVGALPQDDVLALAAGDDRVALGHTWGATAITQPFAPGTPGWAHLDHYVGLRWLPADKVSAAVFTPDGALWLGTDAGLTRVTQQTHTLEEKAQHLETLLQEHFWRMDGFVMSDSYTDDALNPTQWGKSDMDNDGLWTQMMIGAWCYAYAATGNEDYYASARKAMDTMFLQIDVPAVDFEAAGLGRGFITRSLIRDDEGALFANKPTDPDHDRWHLVTYVDGHQYYWKDDTSSDETTGHFFGFPLFHDLCARSDGERADVAEHAAALAGYIVDHNFTLVDLDGQPTTFGQWQPERVAAAADGLTECMVRTKDLTGDAKTQAISWCAESYYGGGWLNGLEILGHLLAAWHLTGDRKFYDAYEFLVTEKKYAVMVMANENTKTVTDPSIANHSDHELAMLAYHTLIRYEPDDVRRAQWVKSLLFLYEEEKYEHNPLWAAFVALAAGFDQTDMGPALQSLREIPFDRRGWRVDNSHRKDAIKLKNDRFDDPQWDRVFPYDEIKTIWWNTNLANFDEGGDGRSVGGPMAPLLAYWALRYAGVIGE